MRRVFEGAPTDFFVYEPVAVVLPEAVPSIVIENALSDADSGDNQPAAHWESPSLRILLAHFEHIDDPERAP